MKLHFIRLSPAPSYTAVPSLRPSVISCKVLVILRWGVVSPLHSHQTGSSPILVILGRLFLIEAQGKICSEWGRRDSFRRGEIIHRLYTLTHPSCYLSP